MNGIDAHTHLSGGSFNPDIFRQGDALGITRYLCSNLGDFQEYPTMEEVSLMNRVMASEVARHPERLMAYCYVNPQHGASALTDLRRNVEDRGMIGVKLWVATTVDDPVTEPILRYAAENRLIVLAHAWKKTVGQMAHESTADNVAVAARRHPDVRFIMAHLGGQPESAVAAIESLPNVVADTSGTVINSGDVRLAVDRLGPDRIVFGSDLPITCLSESVGKVLAAHLPPEQEAKVFGGTIEKWLTEVAA